MIYENDFVKILKEPSQIPWIKIFSKEKAKELSQLSEENRQYMFFLMMEAEKAMLAYYKPKKINIASFANYLPCVHIHVMARFEEDEFYPEPMWGKAKREKIDLKLAAFEGFLKLFLKNINKK